MDTIIWNVPSDIFVRVMFCTGLCPDAPPACAPPGMCARGICAPGMYAPVMSAQGMHVRPRHLNNEKNEVVDNYLLSWYCLSLVDRQAHVWDSPKFLTLEPPVARIVTTCLFLYIKHRNMFLIFKYCIKAEGLTMHVT
jgi:hypothetical protein